MWAIGHRRTMTRSQAWSRISLKQSKVRANVLCIKCTVMGLCNHLQTCGVHTALGHHCHQSLRTRGLPSVYLHCLHHHHKDGTQQCEQVVLTPETHLRRPRRQTQICIKMAQRHASLDATNRDQLSRSIRTPHNQLLSHGRSGRVICAVIPAITLDNVGNHTCGQKCPLLTWVVGQGNLNERAAQAVNRMTVHSVKFVFRNRRISGAHPLRQQGPTELRWDLHALTCSVHLRHQLLRDNRRTRNNHLEGHSHLCPSR